LVTQRPDFAADCATPPLLLLLQVYGNDINKIDVAVGLLAETPLPGWIFGACRTCMQLLTL
jgi:hypothetical protein